MCELTSATLIRAGCQIPERTKDQILSWIVCQLSESVVAVALVLKFPLGSLCLYGVSLRGKCLEACWLEVLRHNATSPSITITINKILMSRNVYLTRKRVNSSQKAARSCGKVLNYGLSRTIGRAKDI